jgi:chromosome segregation ATPase
MLHAREEEIERLRARVGALETKLTSTRDTLGGQKSRLGELLEAIEVTQQEQDRHKALLSEQSAHMQEARKLLDLLRPAMDQLEGDLEKKQTT